MIELVDTNDRDAVRNMNNIVELHEVMINQRRPEEAVAKFMDPGYIQHDPLLATGAEGLAKFFVEILNDRPRARWVGHRIIAVGDWVWVHSNFLNIFNDDPDDTGIAGIDIFKMNSDGRAIEHWEALQIVGTPGTLRRGLGRTSHVPTQTESSESRSSDARHRGRLTSSRRDSTGEAVAWAAGGAAPRPPLRADGVECVRSLVVPPVGRRGRPGAARLGDGKQRRQPRQ